MLPLKLGDPQSSLKPGCLQRLCTSYSSLSDLRTASCQTKLHPLIPGVGDVDFLWTVSPQEWMVSMGKYPQAYCEWTVGG